MNFKELVEADRDIFINLDEFAEEHVVDGSTINAVFEDEEIEDLDESRAVSASTMALFAKTEDLPSRKMQGEVLYVDNVAYTVMKWLEEMGVTKVSLSAPESW